MRNANGQFAEGNEGRKAGVPNKSTTQIKESFQMLLEDNLDQLKLDVKALETKERVKFMLELASFIIPKMKSVDLKSENTETVFIDFSEDISFEEN